MSTRPRTLLQIANAPASPSRLGDAILLLIDPQLEYVTGALPLAGVEAAVEEAARLLDVARNAQMPIFHILHHAREGASVFDPRSAYTASIPILKPRSSEGIVLKSLPNSFAKTDLHTLAQATGRRELIIAGFATHMCVSATTRAALDLGYRSTVIASATATRDLPDPCSADVIPASTIFRGTLAALADRFAVVIQDTAALLAGQPAD